MQIAEEFAKMGKDVVLTPKMERPATFDYDCFYKTLRKTAYKDKCPDFLVDGKWYEHEGYVTSNKQRALSNMLSRGLEQCDRIIIDDPGMTDRYLRIRIWRRIQEGANVSEVWVRSSSGIRLIYKRQREQ